MTVIYSNFGDNDTAVLPLIWQNIPNVRVIEITKDTENFDDIVNNAMYNETDTILFCGHGSRFGLFHPNLSRGEYILHENNWQLIRARNVIGIWCYASDFAREHNLNGFFSSMFISNIYEAYENGLTEANAEQINNDLITFCHRINELLRCNIPINEWGNRLQMQINESNNVEVFNYNGLTFLND